MKIFIDAGHGGYDPGAVGHIKEAEYTLGYSWELARVLRLLGFEVLESRTSDYFVTLAHRCKMANDWGADYFISIHFNAGQGTGIETLALAAGGQSEALAKVVQSEIIGATEAVSRGVKFGNFQVLRDTNMPAILIEGGFVDSYDAERIKSETYKRNFMRRVTKGICRYTSSSWVDPYTIDITPAPVKPVPEPTLSNKDLVLEHLRAIIKLMEEF